MTPRFFIDSADTETWRRFSAEGWVHGATTNPTLLSRAGLACGLETAERLVETALRLGFGELMIQSWGGAADALAETGMRLAALDPIVIVKIPATPQGFAAAAVLKRHGVHVTLTACYTVRQAAAALAAGVDYVAPYYGRMIEAGLAADERVSAMLSLCADSRMRVLVASLRAAEQVDHLLAAGFDTFTLAPEIAAAIAADAHAQAAADVFEQAAAGDRRAR